MTDLAFRDISDHGYPLAIMNGFFGASRGSHFLGCLIRAMIENCRTRFMGTNALCLTGPVLWGNVYRQRGFDARRGSSASRVQHSPTSECYGSVRRTDVDYAY